MIAENSGLLTVAALKHLNVKDKRVVSILSGGNMDVIIAPAGSTPITFIFGLSSLAKVDTPVASPPPPMFTGAYKVRGAYYKLSTLTDEERKKGLITASAGNPSSRPILLGFLCIPPEIPCQ